MLWTESASVIISHLVVKLWKEIQFSINGMRTDPVQDSVSRRLGSGLFLGVWAPVEWSAFVVDLPAKQVDTLSPSMLHERNTHPVPRLKHADSLWVLMIPRKNLLDTLLGAGNLIAILSLKYPRATKTLKHFTILYPWMWRWGPQRLECHAHTWM